MHRAEILLASTLQRPPTVAEIAQELRLKEWDVSVCKAAMKATISLNIQKHARDRTENVIDSRSKTAYEPVSAGLFAVLSPHSLQYLFLCSPTAKVTDMVKQELSDRISVRALPYRPSWWSALPALLLTAPASLAQESELVKRDVAQMLSVLPQQQRDVVSLRFGLAPVRCHETGEPLTSLRLKPGREGKVTFKRFVSSSKTLTYFARFDHRLLAISPIPSPKAQWRFNMQFNKQVHSLAEVLKLIPELRTEYQVQKVANMAIFNLRNVNFPFIVTCTCSIAVTTILPSPRSLRPQLS